MGVNTIHELHKKLVNGQISAVELTQRYIDRKISRSPTFKPSFPIVGKRLWL